MKTINVGRETSGGVFKGLFGNPIREAVVSEHYRIYFRALKRTKPQCVKWLKDKIDAGYKLYCPGCGIDSPTCHARIIEQELK